MGYLYLFARHQVLDSLHCGHTLKAPALCSRVQIVEFIALPLDACFIPVSPNCSTKQALTCLGTTVPFVDVHGVVLFHVGSFVVYVSIITEFVQSVNLPANNP